MSIPILTYHSIDDSGSVVSISPSLFRKHMQILSKLGYKTLHLSEAVKFLSVGETLPGRSAVITFDDGYENVYKNAFPVLKEFGFVSTVFPIAEFAGADDGWPGRCATVQDCRLLSWDQINQMKLAGMEFGSHGLSHRALTTLNPDEQKRELVTSKQILEDKLQQSIDVFAYPYGRLNSSLKDIVASLYSCGCSTRLGRANSGSDLYALERIDAYYIAPLYLFHMLASGLLDFYLGVRQVIRDCRRIS